jgi:RNA polymerase sigma-70 factor (ECF subfamily)
LAPSSISLSIYIENRDDLLNYANRFLGDRAIAEDVVQEAWLRLSSRYDKGQEIVHPLSYLYSIVRNLALDWAKRRVREVPQAPDSVAWQVLPAPTPTAEDVLLQRDEFRALLGAIHELPERTQIAFRMYKLEQRPLQEVADHLKLSVPRTHQIVGEALLHAMQRMLGDEDK